MNPDVSHPVHDLLFPPSVALNTLRLTSSHLLLNIWTAVCLCQGEAACARACCLHSKHGSVSSHDGLCDCFGCWVSHTEPYVSALGEFRQLTVTGQLCSCSDGCGREGLCAEGRSCPGLGEGRLQYIPATCAFSCLSKVSSSHWGAWKPGIPAPSGMWFSSYPMAVLLFFFFFKVGSGTPRVPVSDSSMPITSVCYHNWILELVSVISNYLIAYTVTPLVLSRPGLRNASLANSVVQAVLDKQS